MFSFSSFVSNQRRDTDYEKYIFLNRDYMMHNKVNLFYLLFFSFIVTFIVSFYVFETKMHICMRVLVQLQLPELSKEQNIFCKLYYE